MMKRLTFFSSTLLVVALASSAGVFDIAPSVGAQASPAQGAQQFLRLAVVDLDLAA